MRINPTSGAPSAVGQASRRANSAGITRPTRHGNRTAMREVRCAPARSRPKIISTIAQLLVETLGADAPGRGARSFSRNAGPGQRARRSGVAGGLLGTRPEQETARPDSRLAALTECRRRRLTTSGRSFTCHASNARLLHAEVSSVSSCKGAEGTLRGHLGRGHFTR